MSRRSTPGDRDRPTTRAGSRRWRVWLLVVAIYGVAPHTAFGQPPMYTDRAQWLAALGGAASTVTTVDFEELSASTTAKSVITSKGVVFQIEGAVFNSNGLFILQSATHGNYLLGANDNFYDGFVTMQLPEGTSAFGVDLFQYCAICPTIDVTITDIEGFSFSVEVTSQNASAFFGVISPQSIAFIEFDALSYVVLDNLTFPEVLPNLTMTSLTTGAMTPAGLVSVTDTVSNTSTSGDAGPSTNRYYLDVTPGKTPASTLLSGTRNVPAIAADDSNTGSTMVTIPSGIADGDYYVIGCANDLGTVLETDTTDNCRASPGTIAIHRSITLVNPYATTVAAQRLPSFLDDPRAVAGSPAASGIAADGAAAAVVVVQSPFNAPIALDVTGPAGLLGPIGSLSPYDSTYLAVPTPSGSAHLVVGQPQCDASGCVFLGLLWSPPVIPVSPTDLTAGQFPTISATVTAAQASSLPIQRSLVVEPPPLLLVHGVWSDATAAWTKFQLYLSSNQIYPDPLVRTVDYGALLTPDGYSLSVKSFKDPRVQSLYLSTINDVLATEAAKQIVARRVDVYAHSMGGLATRFLRETLPSTLRPFLPPDPIHKLVTIGTPEIGSQLAVVLNANEGTAASGGLVLDICLEMNFLPGQCTLGAVLAKMGKKVDTATQDLAVGLPQLDYPFQAMVGRAPDNSLTERELNVLIGGFLPGQTVTSIFGTPDHDTIVATSSQAYGAATIDTRLIPGIVHAELDGVVDTGETASRDGWHQVIYWLMGGVGTAPPGTGPQAAKPTVAPVAPDPVFDLTGYTLVDPSNATLTPTSGSTLVINTPVTVTVSSQKALTELLILQPSVDPNDPSFLFATAAPFSVTFTPARTGAVDLVAFVLFADHTYVRTSLHYTLQPNGSAVALQLVNSPTASVPGGSSLFVRSLATFANGSVDVSALATYSARSGGTSIFTIGPDHTITATGAGSDWLDVSYGGLAASALINVVAPCAYTLSASAIAAPKAGGQGAVSVTSTQGCAWIASSDSAWLTITAGPTGVGSGAVQYSIAPNNSGAVRVGTVAAGGRTLTVTQAASDPFTDDVLIPGTTPVRAIHILELRTRIAALRLRYGLPLFGYSHTPIIAGMSVVAAVDILELRVALLAVYTAAGIPAPVFSTLPAGGVVIRATDIAELRAAVVALE